MKDNIGLFLGLPCLSEKELLESQISVEEILKTATRKPIKYGKMKTEIKEAISETLMGHKTSEETKQKISKTISKRNREKVCGFGLGHSSLAGSVGGKSKSLNKLNALNDNRQKSLDIVKGSVWMFNEEKRARVPKSLVDQKVKEGWKIGFNK